MGPADGKPGTPTQGRGDTAAQSRSSGQPVRQATGSPVRRIALAVSAMAFFGWLAWLAYLAVTASKPTVLSRPQFLMANLIVIAEVESLDKDVTVIEVYWPEAKKELEGKELKVTNLAQAATEDREGRGWKGPGRYILPLVQEPDGTYQLAPIPPSPGFSARKLLIYRETPHTRGQLREIRKP